MSCKSEALTQYKNYEAWLQTQHGTRIKRLQTDRGGEYLSEEFTSHLKAQGTLWNLTVHDTPEENGVYKCLNCMLLEHACAMLLASNLPKFLWTESVQHAVWLKNCTTTCVLNGKTPFEVVFKSKPNLKNLLEWGVCIFVL